MDEKQKYIMEKTKEMNKIEITVTYDLIERIETVPIKTKSPLINWEHIKFVMERITNRISDKPKMDTVPYYLLDTPLIPCWNLGHVFNIKGEQVFVELFFEKRVKDSALVENSYIVDDYNIISSDRFLDLMLEGKRVNLSNKPVRLME